MKKVISSLITGFILLFTVSTTNANTITVAGLDWLHFSDTIGLSWNQVYPTLQPGGTRYGWRYAQPGEIESLYTAVHPGWGYGWLTSNEGIVDEIGSILGYTTNNVSGFRMIDGVAYPSAGAWTVTNYKLINSDRYAPADTDNVSNAVINIDATTSFGRPVASYLVRESIIPIPTTIWLFSSGLIGLIVIARRK